MSNFDFLKKSKIFNNFSEACCEAENGLGLNTVTCSILCRRALELGVKWLYANDNDLRIPYNDNLSASKDMPCTSAPRVKSSFENQVPLKPVCPVISIFLFLKKLNIFFISKFSMEHFLYSTYLQVKIYLFEYPYIAKSYHV